MPVDAKIISVEAPNVATVGEEVCVNAIWHNYGDTGPSYLLFKSDVIAGGSTGCGYEVMRKCSSGGCSVCFTMPDRDVVIVIEVGEGLPWDPKTVTDSRTIVIYTRAPIPSLDKCIDNLYYVSVNTYVSSSDINTLVDCMKALSAVLRERVGDDPLVDELDAIIAKMRYVTSGDTILPEDHNYLVDAIKKARDVLARMEEYYKSLIEEYEATTGAGLKAVARVRGAVAAVESDLTDLQSSAEVKPSS